MEGLGKLAGALPHPGSFLDLPVELRLKCLASCDWKTLSVAACANRGTRALVCLPGAAGRGVGLCCTASARQFPVVPGPPQEFQHPLCTSALETMV